MKPGPGNVSNRISGGVFFGAVVMGRDVQVVLPAEVTPAMTGLPGPSAVFTGRETEVAALVSALRPDGPGGAHQITAVAGMGGVGKTELVVHAAHLVLAEPDWFPGGVLFVDMFGYDPQRRLSAGDALLGWLHAIGIPGEHIPESEQDRSRLWRSVVDAYTGEDRRLLLVIDNVADEGQVAPLLPAGARTPVLVTSRHTLDIDARLHDLDSLGEEASATLIGDVVAGRRGADDPRLHDETERAAITELARLCAGLPLALRIVAALLADRPHLKPSALADRLRDEQSRLDGLSRHQVAVRAAFDLSYRDLSDAQARLFRLLPVNPGPDIATPAAAALAGLPQAETTVLLEDLFRAHLITEPTADRWGMHDLLRLHAADQPAADAHETATARVGLYYHYGIRVLASATLLDPATPDDHQFFPGRAEALAFLDAEHANLVAVCTAAAALDDPIAVTIVLALPDFLRIRRHFTDWISLSSLAAELCRRIGDLRREGGAWTSLGNALLRVRRFDDALAAHHRARDIFQRIGDPASEAKSWNNAGVVLLDLRRSEEAITALRNARDLHRQTGDQHREAQTSGNIGIALAGLGRFDEALAEIDAARAVLAEAGDDNGVAWSWNDRGGTLIKAGRFDEALVPLGNARDHFVRVGDEHSAAQAFDNLGVAFKGAGRVDEAVEAHVAAVAGFQRASDRHREGMAWRNLGIAFAARDRPDHAVMALSQAHGAFDDSGDEHGMAVVWDEMGLAFQQLGRYADAVGAHHLARDHYRRAGDRRGEGVAGGRLGVALLLIDRPGQARDAGAEAVAALTEAGAPEAAALIQDWMEKQGLLE